MRRRVDPGLILVLTPLLWGATFPATRIALRSLSVPAFTAWSRGLGLLTVLALLPWLRRADPGRMGQFRSSVVPAVVLGSLMFAGYALQTEGQARTTATNTAFITTIYVVLVPLIGAVVFHRRVGWRAWVAVAISMAGLVLLSVTDLGQVGLHVGDLLVLAGAVAWAGHIVAVGQYSPRLPAWILSVGQLAVAAGLHLAWSVPGGIQAGIALTGEVFGLLVLTGILGTGVAFTIQVVAQRSLSAARAVVLLAGESLFAALFASIWIDERLRVHQWIGALMVLGAMALSEVAARQRHAGHLGSISA